MASFGTKSKERLVTCHPDLQRVFNEVIKIRDCAIITGHRKETEQNEAFSSGNSEVEWPDSDHNSTPSNAVDVMPYYSNKPHIHWNVHHDPVAMNELREFAGIVKGVAHVLGVKIKWGGNFKSFFDGPHWALVE